MIDSAPFKYQAYWTSFAEDSTRWPPSPLAEQLFDRLPEDLVGGVMIEYGAGGLRDTNVLACHPGLKRIHVVDAVPATAILVAHSMQGAARMKLRGDLDHFADITCVTKPVEAVTAQDLPANADAFLACGLMPYVKDGHVLQVSKVAASVLKPGGLFVANYAALGSMDHASRDAPPIACVSADELKAMLAESGMDGTVVGMDHMGKPTRGEPSMFEVVATKRMPGRK